MWLGLLDALKLLNGIWHVSSRQERTIEIGQSPSNFEALSDSSVKLMCLQLPRLWIANTNTLPNNKRFQKA